jgi:hypothetical protein
MFNKEVRLNSRLTLRGHRGFRREAAAIAILLVSSAVLVGTVSPATATPGRTATPPAEHHGSLPLRGKVVAAKLGSHRQVAGRASMPLRSPLGSHGR